MAALVLSRRRMSRLAGWAKRMERPTFISTSWRWWRRLDCEEWVKIARLQTQTLSSVSCFHTEVRHPCREGHLRFAREGQTDHEYSQAPFVAPMFQCRFPLGCQKRKERKAISAFKRCKKRGCVSLNDTKKKSWKEEEERWGQHCCRLWDFHNPCPFQTPSQLCNRTRFHCKPFFSWLWTRKLTADTIPALFILGEYQCCTEKHSWSTCDDFIFFSEREKHRCLDKSLFLLRASSRTVCSFFAQGALKYRMVHGVANRIWATKKAISLLSSQH